jgi:hypothetical protein
MEILLWIVGIIAIIVFCFWIDNSLGWLSIAVLVVFLLFSLIKFTAEDAEKFTNIKNLNRQFEKEIKLFEPGDTMDLRRFDSFPDYIYRIPNEKSITINNNIYIVEKVEKKIYRLYGPGLYILYMTFESVKTNKKFKLIKVTKQKKLKEEIK